MQSVFIRRLLTVQVTPEDLSEVRHILHIFRVAGLNGNFWLH